MGIGRAFRRHLRVADPQAIAAEGERHARKLVRDHEGMIRAAAAEMPSPEWAVLLLDSNDHDARVDWIEPAAVLSPRFANVPRDKVAVYCMDREALAKVREGDGYPAHAAQIRAPTAERIFVYVIAAGCVTIVLLDRTPSDSER